MGDFVKFRPILSKVNIFATSVVFVISSVFSSLEPINDYQHNIRTTHQDAPMLLLANFSIHMTVTEVCIDDIGTKCLHVLIGLAVSQTCLLYTSDAADE